MYKHIKQCSLSILYLPIDSNLTIVLNFRFIFNKRGPSWPRSYGSWIYNYLWYQCLSPL